MEMNDVYLILLQVGVLAISIETALKAVFATKAYKKFVENSVIGEFLSKPTIAIVASLILCYSIEYDFISKILQVKGTDIGIILTALLISRGSNGIADFLNRRKRIKDALARAQEENIKNNGLNIEGGKK